MKIAKFIILLIITLLLSFFLTASSCLTTWQTSKIRLTWENSQDVVAYEMEILTKPYLPNDSVPPTDILYHTTAIFTPGVELDLHQLNTQHIDKLYYRIRPLDLNKKPIATFSAAMPLMDGQLNPPKPQPTALFDTSRPMPLYPTYSWIPVLGAQHYVVEITKGAPENPNGIIPSAKRVRSYTVDGGFDCYDTHACLEEGTYYWRVLALNSYYFPIGTFSDAIPFHVAVKHYTWAVFGDSITHGGGAVSNPPSDIRFDYSSYLPYEVKNLWSSFCNCSMISAAFVPPRILLPLASIQRYFG